jgi:hypothetical protein
VDHKGCKVKALVKTKQRFKCRPVKKREKKEDDKEDDKGDDKGDDKPVVDDEITNPNVTKIDCDRLKRIFNEFEDVVDAVSALYDEVSCDEALTRAVEMYFDL